MTDREELAAELALRLIEGEELLAARGLMARDAAFAGLVADWDARLAPLYDAIDEVAPPHRVWAAIEMALADERPVEVARLRGQVRRWRLGAGIAAALALALALVGLPGRAPDAPAPPLPEHVLTASLAPRGGGSLSLVYLPDQHRLVAVAAGLPARPGHDLELWVLPPGSPPRSLGVAAPGASRRLPLTPELARALADGSAVAVTLEPSGGSPSGLPTGPVVASGKIAAT